jgi:nitrite reductase/ring-hydroxylating ferredoxin subunit/uncharacterized membrane protein
VLNPEISLNDRLTDRIARNSALGKVARVWQPAILRLRDAAGAPGKYFLNGTFLGHSLHPLLTDIPIGAWTVTALLDGIEVFDGPDVAFASDAALALGLAGAVGAIATGYADWADTSDDPRTLGMAHAALNGAAFTGYVTSLLLRANQKRGAGIAVAMASYGLMTFAAFLGGELMAGYQLGTKHTAEPKMPPEKYVKVASLDDIADGAMHAVEVDGIPIVLLRQGNEVFAISGACTHRGAPLREGTLEGDACVRCPWHGSVFSFRDGTAVEGPATFPQATFETRVVKGSVELRKARVSG